MKAPKSIGYVVMVFLIDKLLSILKARAIRQIG